MPVQRLIIEAAHHLQGRLFSDLCRQLATQEVSSPQVEGDHTMASLSQGQAIEATLHGEIFSLNLLAETDDLAATLAARAIAIMHSAPGFLRITTQHST
jgi:hypothetical protein